jgi:hypothetical protein
MLVICRNQQGSLKIQHQNTKTGFRRKGFKVYAEVT